MSFLDKATPVTPTQPNNTGLSFASKIRPATTPVAVPQAKSFPEKVGDVASFVAKDVTGAGEPQKPKSFFGRLFQSTLGSKGLAGVAQLPGKTIAAVSEYGPGGAHSAEKMYQIASNYSDQSLAATEKARTETDPNIKNKLHQQAIDLQREAQNIIDEANKIKGITDTTGRQATGIGANAALTVAPFGEIAGGATKILKSVGLGSKAAKITGQVITGAGTGQASSTANELADNKTVKEAVTFDPLATGIGAGLPLVGPLLKTGGKAFKSTGKFAVSQASGLSPKTIEEVVKNPGEFSNKSMQAIDRNSVAGNVKESIDKRLSDLSSIGKEYEPIRTIQKNVSIPQSAVKDVLAKYGLNLEDGKIITTSESKPISRADKAALEDFIKTYGANTSLTPNGFLNTREALSELSRYELGSGKTKNIQTIARDLRSFYDTMGKDQIPGLKEIDEKYAPEVKILKQIKKDYINKQTGEFKDGAINKIANLTGKGKDEVLGRLKEIVPDIENRVNVLRAVEDIQAAYGQKVGSYTRSIIAGGIGFGAGNVPGAIMAAIVTAPGNAVKILRAYGYTSKNVSKVIDALSHYINRGSFNFPGDKILERDRIRVFPKDQSLKGADIHTQNESIKHYVQNKSDLLDQYVEKNGKVVNTDEARKLFKDQGYIGSNAAAVQEASSAISKDAYKHLLKTSKEPDVLITSGGSGTGKTTAIRNILPEDVKNAGVILDGNLSTIKSAENRILEAHNAGKNIKVAYVYRDPVDAWEHGVIDRMINNKDEGGRIVPLSVFLQNHEGSYNVARELKAKGIDISIIDNSLGKGNQEIMDPVKFQKISYNKEKLKSKLVAITMKLYDQGRITKEQLEKLLS